MKGIIRFGLEGKSIFLSSDFFDKVKNQNYGIMVAGDYYIPFGSTVTIINFESDERITKKVNLIVVAMSDCCPEIYFDTIGGIQENSISNIRTVIGF